MISHHRTTNTSFTEINTSSTKHCLWFFTAESQVLCVQTEINTVHQQSIVYDFSPQNDEYVVYSVNQQRLRYLVEFTVDEEKPGASLDIDNSDIMMDTDLPSLLADIGQLLPVTHWWGEKRLLDELE